MTRVRASLMHDSANSEAKRRDSDSRSTDEVARPKQIVAEARFRECGEGRSQRKKGMFVVEIDRGVRHQTYLRRVRFGRIPEREQQAKPQRSTSRIRWRDLHRLRAPSNQFHIRFNDPPQVPAHLANRTKQRFRRAPQLGCVSPKARNSLP